jgi:hypothetical protein
MTLIDAPAATAVPVGAPADRIEGAGLVERADLVDGAELVERYAVPERPGLVERYAAALAALDEVSTEAADYRELPESVLLEINQIGAASRRLVDSHLALVAGEVAFRSRSTLGLSGLAQRLGLRTAEQFVKVTTGSTARDAKTAVRVGVLMHDAATAGEVDENTGVIAENPMPWLAPVTDALASRTLSVDQADAIQTGLAEPDSAITASQLTDAAEELVKACEVGCLDPDALAKLARQVREELDLEGVGLREEERRQKRSLRLYRQPDGTTKLVWIMDPETAATVREVVDRATSPKLGGVRFVDPERQARADSIALDDRTPEQLGSDALVQLIKIGADADPGVLLGSGAPVIRVTATAVALETGIGLGRIDGQASPVSMATVKRLTCFGTIHDVIFDTSLRPLDVGRDHRLFTAKQREAIIVKWGGCAADNCDRPPSWTEIHHIEHWQRDRGRTNVDLGVPLCAHHHRQFHNSGWEIRLDADGRYWLVKPPGADAMGSPPTILSAKGRNMIDLSREPVLPSGRDE